MKQILIVALVLATLTLAGCVADEQGIKVGDPRAFAEATQIARLSDQALSATAQAVTLEATRQAGRIQAEATRAAIAAQDAQAKADIQRANADAVRNALPAATVGKAITNIGLGLGALVVVVGLAFAFTGWVNKRASAIYPDKRGLYPILKARGLGWIAYHDPNRGLGPSTVVRTPTALDALAGAAIASAQALENGARPELPTAEPQTAFALPGGEQTMLQVSTQAQIAQATVSQQSGRPKFVLSVTQPGGADPRSAARGRMPAVTVVNDPKQIEDFERKLLSDGSD